MGADNVFRVVDYTQILFLFILMERLYVDGYYTKALIYIGMLSMINETWRD